jgi:hypothetical protein
MGALPNTENAGVTQFDVGLAFQAVNSFTYNL